MTLNKQIIEENCCFRGVSSYFFAAPHKFGYWKELQSEHRSPQALQLNELSDNKNKQPLWDEQLLTLNRRNMNELL